MTTLTEVEVVSNIITPPDFVYNANSNVVAIDPSESDVESIAYYLKSSPLRVNLYVYDSTESNDPEWLETAIARSDALLINTAESSISHRKDKLAVDKKAYHYGAKRFLMSMDRHLESPIEYFIKQISPK